MGEFKIKSKFNPTGDQPQAIEALLLTWQVIHSFQNI